MNKDTSRSKPDKLLEMTLLATACIAFCAILILSFGAIKNLSTGYKELVNADLSSDLSQGIYYDDHLYVVLGRGIVLDETAAVADRPAIMSAFLKDALSYIDQRIMASGILYAMMISAIMLYPLTKRYPRHVWLFGPLVFAAYLIFEIVVHALLAVPFYLPDGAGIIKVLSGLIAVSGGSCALSLLIRHARYQKLVSVVIVPLVFALFLVGMYLEFGLHSPKTIESFDYAYAIDGRILEEGYYDSEKNVLVFEDKEYPPKQTENPDHYSGVRFIGAAAFEVINPYSGNGLYLTEQAMESQVSLPVYLLYALKGVLWIVLCGRKKDETV